MKFFVITNYYKSFYRYDTANERFDYVKTLAEAEFHTTLTVRSIKNVITRFESNKCLCDKRKQNTGRIRTATSDSNIHKIIDSVETNPTQSISERAAEHNMAFSSIQRILKKAKVKPYKPIEGQKLSEPAKRLRVQFCTKMMRSTIDFTKIIFSDEKRFYLNRPKNHQNNRYWSHIRPEGREVNELEAHPPSVHVWAALSASEVIGPFFFEATIDQYEYQKMIDFYLWPKIRNRDLTGVWFQQDGATAHCTLNTLELLSVYFDGKVISRNAATEWPPHSPDLNPLDYFLWGVLDEKVQQRRPGSLRQLKAYITDEFNKLDRSILPTVISNFAKRLEKCVLSNGAHFAHLL